MERYYHYKGGFARVYQLTVNETKKVVAVKLVPKNTLTLARAKQKLISEIRIHRSLSHKSIVGFEHYFEDNDNVYILLEMCHNQTLSELIRRRRKLHEIEVQCYIRQLLEGVKYLHDRKIIHRE